MIRSYRYKGRHRMWRCSCITVADLLDGYDWSFPECGVVELRSRLSLPSALAWQKKCAVRELVANKGMAA